MQSPLGCSVGHAGLPHPEGAPGPLWGLQMMAWKRHSEPLALVQSVVPACVRRGLAGAGTHVAQVQELGFAGQAEEGGADGQVNLWEEWSSVPGWGEPLRRRMPAHMPVPRTCRVGSRVAKSQS